MRIILSALALVFLSTIASAQTSPSPTPSPDPEVHDIGNPARPALPVLKFKPKITLQHALKLAEGVLEKEEPKGMAYYLLEARLIPDNDGGDAFDTLWLFTWKHESAQPVFDLQITVSMSGKVTMRLNAFLQRPRQRE